MEENIDKEQKEKTEKALKDAEEEITQIKAGSAPAPEVVDLDTALAQLGGYGTNYNEGATFNQEGLYSQNSLKNQLLNRIDSMSEAEVRGINWNKVTFSQLLHAINK